MNFQIPFFCPVFKSRNVKHLLAQEELEMDDQSLFRPLEMMILPQSKVKILNQISDVLEIEFQDSAHLQRGFILNQFLESKTCLKFDTSLIDKDTIIRDLLSFAGKPYVWGSNWILNQRYRETLNNIVGQLGFNVSKHLDFLFSGIDCSGLLYAVTGGVTPRNTQELVSFGDGLFIEGCSIDEICNKIEPLDLIVWTGHVLIVIDKETVIESRHPFGVVASPIKSRLEEITKTRRPSQVPDATSFVIRRFAKKDFLIKFLL